MLKNGLYAVALTKEERDLFDRIELGNVDDEIKIIRLRLRRALILIAKEDKGEAPELRLEETKTEGQGKFKKTTTVKRAPDLETRIEVWTSRIAHLERLRAELLGKLPQTPPAPTPVHVHFD